MVNMYNGITNTLGLDGIRLDQISGYLNSEQGSAEVQEFFDDFRFIRMDIRWLKAKVKLNKYKV